MRTTLTLEPDTSLKLKKRMAAWNLTLKQAVNKGAPRRLAGDEAPRRVRFRVEPHSFGFKPGIDPDKLNQLADELEAEEFARK